MSGTLILWLVGYAILALAAFARPAWGIGLYLLSFYMFPPLWWWGKGLHAAVSRINLITALVFAAAVFISTRGATKLSASNRFIFGMLLLYAVNATFVHFMFAANPERSLEGMTMIWKQLGLLLLISLAIQQRRDLLLFAVMIILGSLFFGYEIVINERGSFRASRLEGIGAPGVGDSNFLSAFLALCLPLASYFLYFGRPAAKAVMLVVLVLVFESIIRCNSRGCFLGMIAGMIWLLSFSTGRARRYALISCVLALSATAVMVGDQDIKDRFMSIFASAEERDNSASSRLFFWRKASEMMVDYPMGSGAEAAFKSNRGQRYVASYTDEFKAVHNGPLDIGASWGFQGLGIYSTVIVYVWWRVRRTRLAAVRNGEIKDAYLGACIESILIMQLVASMFLSSLDGEWFFWLFGFAMAYDRLYGPDQEAGQDPPDETEYEDEDWDEDDRDRYDPDEDFDPPPSRDDQPIVDAEQWQRRDRFPQA